MKNDIIEIKKVDDFFRDQVQQAIYNTHADLSPEVEYYLVHLLSEFSKTDAFFHEKENGSQEEKPLAISFLESFLKNPDKSFFLLKKTGDISLYTVGFFGESIMKKIIDIDYYMNIGHMAYVKISQLMSNKKNLSSLFHELGHNFPALVDVITEISHQSQSHSSSSLLHLLEKWKQTGSDRIKEILRSKGISTQYFLDSSRSKH